MQDSGNNENNAHEQEENLSEILQIRREKLSELIENNKCPYDITSYENNSSSKDIIENFDNLLEKEVSISGRIVSRRMMGKASFMHLMDYNGKIQVYVKKDIIGEEEYAEFKKYDIGDIIGIKGTPFKTKTEEISVKVSSIVLLSKSLRPLPEKWHGLKDSDLRYRMRYLDLIVNTEVKEAFIKRSQIIKSVRETLDTLGFLEVETPILNTIAGGANAKPFVTHHNTLDIDMYLRIAPELFLKRLIVGGFDKVYEIGRLFRNEGMSVKHNPEFTSVELYEAYVDQNRMMDICEKVFVNACTKVNGTTKIEYQGTEIDLSPGWKRITMNDAVKEATSVDFLSLSDEDARTEGKRLKLEISDNDSKGIVLNLAFEEFVEEKLIQPTFITEYPVEVSPLAKRFSDKPNLTRRFEMFVTGREMANAFSELNDPIDQKERFLSQVAKRAGGDDEAHMMDEDYVEALEYGMPPTGGMGIGIDRMVMLLTDSASIRDVILFPTMKPKNN